jgi:hypothetical protein
MTKLRAVAHLDMSGDGWTDSKKLLRTGVGELRAAFRKPHTSLWAVPAMQEIPVRCGGDDKVEGGGTPFHEWRWMDRLEKATPDRGFSRRL